METIESLTRHLVESRGVLLAHTQVLMHLIRHSPEAKAAFPSMVAGVETMSLLWQKSTEQERATALAILELLQEEA